VAEWNAALDQVEHATGPAALIAAAEGRFWSNGLDVGALAHLGAEGIGAFMGDLDRLYARVLTFARPTAAAISGHAFAAGGMLAVAHDFRVMRADRGHF
jgi:enoyl-CoA hydratase/carnithine racemase